jgi:hypothetical protein
VSAYFFQGRGETDYRARIVISLIEFVQKFQEFTQRRKGAKKPAKNNSRDFAIQHFASFLCAFAPLRETSYLIHYQILVEFGA